MKTARLLAALAAVPVGAAHARRHDPPRPAPPAARPADAVTAAPLTDAPPAPVRYDFGARSALDPSPIARDFSLVNRTAAPITLVRLQAACGCTTALLSGAGGASLPLTLAPGGAATVHVSVDPSHLLPGTAVKDVWVYAQGRDTPAATLEIAGAVRPAAAFSPPAADFGRGGARDARPLTLTVTLDPAAVAALGPAGKADPVLLCNDGAVRVEPLPPAGADPLSRAFRLSLAPDAHLGVLDARLTLFASPAERDAGRAVPGATVPVLGEVTGSVSASPAAVLFGAVSAGAGGTVRVTLTANAPGALKGLTLFSAHPSVTARLLGADGRPLAPDAAPATATLEVVCRPKAASPPLVGSLQSQLVVTTRTGERLELPVTVSVTE